MILTEFEKRRAANLIWNAAGDYTISPGFRIYDEDGRADLYWNSMIGASYRHYDWKKLKEFYNSFHETVDQELYENFFWIALENACYGKEKSLRPAFPELRRDYAERKLKNFMPGIAESRDGWITEGHFRRVLGEDSGLPDLVDRKLLSEIELGPELDTEQWIAALSKTLQKYFTYLPGKPAAEQKHRRKLLIPQLFSLLRRKGRRERGTELSPVHQLAIGFSEELMGRGGEDGSPFRTHAERYAAVTEAGLRNYIISYFGLPLYDEARSRELTERYCRGSHSGCRLHFTRGRMQGEEKGFVGRMHREMRAQRERNLQAFHREEARNRAAVSELVRRIQNALLRQMEAETLRFGSGELCASRIFRALYCGDSRIFDRTVPGADGSLSVDLLLDASASQQRRMEVVSAQGYIIAESLSRCRVPVRVWSYSSMVGYTILTLFRDYRERERNEEIFRYFTTGANRDGLALRAVAGQMEESEAEHRILILLTDEKPNDMVKLKSCGEEQAYAGPAAVSDCAEEVHKLRMRGIHVLCVYTGLEEDLPDVRRVFQQSFVRIRSLDRFASAVGGLLQGEIRRL